MRATRVHPEQKIRVLHSIGHLLRGGIETWLFQTLTAQPPSRFDHHILVRTEAEESFSAGFREAGLPVLVCTGFANPIRYAANFKRLVKTFGPYDILHVHGSSFSGLLTLALAKLSGISKTIVHSHNDVRPLLKTRGALYSMYVALVLLGYRLLGDLGFAASILAAESMFGREWKKDKRWKLLYYGIDCAPFIRPADKDLRTKLGIPGQAIVIGHVGRFHEQKNHAFLVDIIQAAIQVEPNVHCLLIGDGPLRREVKEDIVGRGLEDHFTIIADTTSISEYMISAMDLFVFPSRYEGLGIVAVEAQAAGLPCLISDRVPAEAIVDPLLVSVLPLEKSPLEWADFALNLDRSRGHSSTAHATVQNSRFSLEHCVATLQISYAQLVDR